MLNIQYLEPGSVDAGTLDPRHYGHANTCYQGLDAPDFILAGSTCALELMDEFSVPCASLILRGEAS